MDEQRETRCMKCKFELRAAGDGKRTIVGYAATFNQLSEDMGGWREMIVPGAFDDVLSDDVRAATNHDPNLLLGRTPETLALSVDAVGLRYEITPPDTGHARDLLVSIDRGDMDQSSFSFEAGEVSWVEPTEAQPLPVRKIIKVKRLWDVAPVTYPAYPTTSVAARSMAERMAGRDSSSLRNAPQNDMDDGSSRAGARNGDGNNGGGQAAAGSSQATGSGRLELAGAQIRVRRAEVRL